MRTADEIKDRVTQLRNRLQVIDTAIESELKDLNQMQTRPRLMVFLHKERAVVEAALSQLFWAMEGGD